MKEAPALSGGALTWTLGTRQFLLPVRAYGLASACAMRCVTGACDLDHQLRKGRGLGQTPFFSDFARAPEADCTSARRCRCGATAFRLMCKSQIL